MDLEKNTNVSEEYMRTASVFRIIETKGLKWQMSDIQWHNLNKYVLKIIKYFKT